jgi:hypothetical protein
MLAFAVLAAVISPIMVWTGGDDGLTQRFSGAFQREIERYQVPTAAHLKVTIEQIEPLSRSRSKVTVRFEQSQRPTRLVRCTFAEDSFESCVSRTARLAAKLSKP